MKKKLLTALLAACSIAGIAGVRTASAYLSYNEKLSNTFTVGHVEIEGVEPNWSTTDDDNDGVPDASEHLIQHQEITKDPMIKNTGTNDAVVFMRIHVPRKKYTPMNSNGTPSTAAIGDIFMLKTANTPTKTHQNVFNTSSTGWVELPNVEKTSDDESIYVFAWQQKLAPNATTDSVFDKIQMCSYITGEITDADDTDIKIDYYAIQAENIWENHSDIAEDLTPANLLKIYKLYITQNGVKGGN